MIYYLLSVLILAGIRDVLLISSPDDIDISLNKRLLSDGHDIGMNFNYKVQEKPRGIADAFIVGADFIGKDGVCMILGDNIFYGQDLTSILNKVVNRAEGATIFAYRVKDPRAFGVVEFTPDGKVISIEEKPEKPKSHYAIPGLYFYDSRIVEIAKNLKPSARGEIEITSINQEYLNIGELCVELLGRGMAWLDTGTTDGMLRAAEYVETIQSRQGYYISCIEEIAWRRGFIDDEQLRLIGQSLSMTDYGKYILTLLE